MGGEEMGSSRKRLGLLGASTAALLFAAATLGGSGSASAAKNGRTFAPLNTANGKRSARLPASLARVAAIAAQRVRLCRRRRQQQGVRDRRGCRAAARALGLRHPHQYVEHRGG